MRNKRDGPAGQPCYQPGEVIEPGGAVGDVMLFADIFGFCLVSSFIFI
jgi:hypothetical protein